MEPILEKKNDGSERRPLLGLLELLDWLKRSGLMIMIGPGLDHKLIGFEPVT